MKIASRSLPVKSCLATVLSRAATSCLDAVGDRDGQRITRSHLVSAVIECTEQVTRAAAVLSIVEVCMRHRIVVALALMPVWAGVTPLALAQPTQPPAFSADLTRAAVRRVMTAAADWQLEHPSAH